MTQDNTVLNGPGPRPLQRWLRAYGAALLGLCVLDGLWLGWASGDLYQVLQPWLGPVRWGPAALFYLGYPAGLVTLCLGPRPAHIRVAALRGALMGLMAYGTYDLSNLATLRDWPLGLSLIDLLWGTALSAALATLGYWAQGLGLSRSGQEQ
jgi:uncharacterized membrane protein